MNTKETNPAFYSLDDPNLQWPPFMYAMLKIAQIMTRKERQRFALTADQISRAMIRHRLKVGTIYRAVEIREHISNYGCFFTGGGVQVEAQQIDGNYKTFHHYLFTFTRLINPDEEEETNE